MDNTSISITVGLITKGFSALSGDIGKLSALTNRLSAAGKEVGKLNERISKISAIKANISINKQNIASELSNVAEIAAKISSVALPVKLAIDYEDAFADVKKVVDFSDNGEMKKFSNELLKMSQVIPLSAKELTQIAAAGGQMGIAKDELLEFTQITAKLAVAFDTTADSAGESIGKIKNILNMDLAQTKGLMDVINGLSNSNPAKASELVEIMKRIAAQGKQIGLASEKTAALGAAFISLGKAPETAANAANKLMKTLGNISTLDEKGQKALSELGIDKGYILAGMKADPSKMMISFLERIKSVDDSKRGAILNTLFGDNYDTDIATLIGGLDTLKKAMADVADTSKFKDSADKEFENKSSTTASAIKRLQGAWSAFGISIGEMFLPAINALSSFLANIAKTLSYIHENFPVASKIVFGFIGGFMAFSAIAPMLKIARYGFSILFSEIKIAYQSTMWLANALKLVASRSLLTSAYTKALASAQRACQAATIGLGKVYKTLAAAMSVSIKAIKSMKFALISTGIGAIVVALGMAAAYLMENWDEVKVFFLEIWESVKPYWESTTKFFSDLWQGVSDFLSAIFEPVIKIWDELFGGFFDWIAEKFGWINDMISEAIKGLSSAWSKTKEFFGFGSDEQASSELKPKDDSGGFFNSIFGSDSDTHAKEAPALVAASPGGGAINISFNGDFLLNSNNGKFDLESFKAQIVKGVKDALRRDEFNRKNTDVRG